MSAEPLNPIPGASSIVDGSVLGGIVLAGGQSRRMGRSKAHLPFGNEFMLQRVVRILADAVGPIVVVGAPGQDLPALATDVSIACDAVADRGPLEGLAAGLTTLQGKCDAAYVCGCDVPLLNPAFVWKMLELLHGHQIAVPYVDQFHHPLAAVYRLDVLENIHALLAADRRRPFYLFESTDTRIVTQEELMDVDPELQSLRNCNRPKDYEFALATAGLDA